MSGTVAHEKGLAAGRNEEPSCNNPYRLAPWHASAAGEWERGRKAGELEVLKRRRPEFWTAEESS